MVHEYGLDVDPVDTPLDLLNIPFPSYAPAVNVSLHFETCRLTYCLLLQVCRGGRDGRSG
jgi:hypothetical protein